MPSARSRFGPASAAGVFLASLALLLADVHPAGTTASPAAADEMRALWVLRSSLSSRASIDTLVRSARSHGFNTLFVQVRGRGDAYYTSTLEPRASELARQPPGFDPLADVLARAHAAGLKVHAWVNLNLAASAIDLPTAANHVIRRHPSWLMVPREMAAELTRLDPAAPAYLGKLAWWTKQRREEIEGLYTSPAAPGAVDHLTLVVREIARRYPVDGVHFDYARYPSDRFDYSRSTIEEFRATLPPALTASASGARPDPASLLGLPDAFPHEWRQFRIARMTTLIERVSRAARTGRPGAAVSVAAAADIQDALDRKLQDWTGWLDRGLIDAVAPMAYTTEPTRFAAQIAAARAAAGPRKVWAGIGAYRLSPAQTIDNIATARRLGAGGVILFSYDSLIDPARGGRNYLATVGREW